MTTTNFWDGHDDVTTTFFWDGHVEPTELSEVSYPLSGILISKIHRILQVGVDRNLREFGHIVVTITKTFGGHVVVTTPNFSVVTSS